MKYPIVEAFRSAFKLVRFLFWYAVAVAGVLYVLPMAAIHLQEQYDALNSVARLLALVGMLLVIAIWQIRDFYSRSCVKDQADVRTGIQQ
jgi:type III secretory pathway component EscS